MTRAARAWTRRGLLVVGGLGLVGCAGTGDGDPGARPSPAGSGAPAAPRDPSSDPSSSPAPSGPEPLPRATPWRPTSEEVEPDAKVVAAREVERRGRGRGRVTQVVYPQYGGLEATTASVMVVARETRRDGAALRRTLRTTDVRLARGGTGWRVTEVIPAPDRRAGRLGRSARRLVDDPRVQLPAPAVADLRAGTVEPLVVDVLLGLAEEFSMSVAVFASGHPPTVFGTDGLSNHTRGRAVDVWAVDGRPVVEMPLDDPLLIRFLDAARELGSTEIGGPVVPPGDTGVHFANALHRDHVHVGFDL